ncbi:MAG: ABC transporter permease [Sporanaerobacter sp.]|jgi:ABC-2 type transport system permease protein|uniref:ABC-2 transporter permease n=1 Tax=Sporanaerobacter sp. TaxID=2010183 RepID=UPI003A101BC8
MIGLLKRDLHLIISDKKNRFFFLLYIPFLLLIVESYDQKWPYFIILYTYTYLIAITPFSYDMTYKTSYMMSSLPISRKEMVLYKYLLTFIYFVITVVYAGVYLWIINTLGITTVDYFNLEVIKAVIPVILISISFLYPAYFRFEPKIAQIVHMIIFISSFVAMMNVANLGENSLVSHIKFLSDNYILPISIVLYILSLLLSMKLYETRDL